MARILIVEDEKAVGDLMLLLIEGMGHDVTLATSGAAGLDLLAKFNHEVVLADIHMEPMDGLQFIAQVKERHPRSVFVFISGDDSPDLLVKGMKLGALEFLHKPVRVDELSKILRRALNRVEKERVEKERASKEVATTAAPAGWSLEEVVQELETFFPGKPYGLVRKQMAQLLTVSRHALIEAPPGMLTPALLHTMHRMSAFAKGPLVVRDAATEPIVSVEELLAPAERGLLVLLNLEAVPAKLQQALMTQLREADKMRVIATTRRDPDQLMIEGGLVGALYSRLALCALRLPSLTELEAKLPEILAAALQKTPAYPFGKTAVEIDATAAQALRTYTWPEELTELWSVANHLVAHLKEPRLTLAQLPERICGARLPRLEQYLRKAEAQHVQRALRVLATVPQAAEAMGVSTAELEAYQHPTQPESFFILKRNVAAPPPPPPPPVDRVLLIAGDEIVRHAAQAALSAKGMTVTAVADGLAAVAAVVLAVQPFAAAVIIPPVALLETEELGAQLARLDPRLRLGLLGEPPVAASSPFHAVAPPFRTCEDLEGLFNELMAAVVERPAA